MLKLNAKIGQYKQSEILRELSTDNVFYNVLKCSRLVPYPDSEEMYKKMLISAESFELGMNDVIEFINDNIFDEEFYLFIYYKVSKNYPIEYYPVFKSERDSILHFKAIISSEKFFNLRLSSLDFSFVIDITNSFEEKADCFDVSVKSLIDLTSL